MGGGGVFPFSATNNHKRTLMALNRGRLDGVYRMSMPFIWLRQHTHTHIHIGTTGAYLQKCSNILRENNEDVSNLSPTNKGNGLSDVPETQNEHP